MYDNAEYANSRLMGTIVRYGREPVTVDLCSDNKVLGNISVSFTFLKDNCKKVAALEELNLVPVSLGWANSPFGISYLARASLRKDWRQGLRDNTLRSLYGVDCRNIPLINLRDCIIEKYPTFSYALEEVTCFPNPIAFSRKFALAPRGDDIYLLYKYFGAVGDVVNGRIHLKDRFGFLIESLDEVFKNEHH